LPGGTDVLIKTVVSTAVYRYGEVGRERKCVCAYGWMNEGARV